MLYSTLGLALGLRLEVGPLLGASDDMPEVALVALIVGTSEIPTEGALDGVSEGTSVVPAEVTFDDVPEVTLTDSLSEGTSDGL